MYKRMLVPLDGSELAEAALAFAKQLSGRLKLDVTFLHVCGSDESRFASMHHAYVDWVADNMKRQLKEAGIPVEAQGEAVVGHPAEEILQYAQKNRIDLILMASHGRSGVMRWALGSVADKVLRASEIPVWLVRAASAQQSDYDKWLKITALVPLDGSELAEQILPYVEAMVKQRGAEIVDVVLIRVCEPPAIPSDYPPGMPLSWDEHVEQEMAKCSQRNEQYLSAVERRLRDADLSVRSQLLMGKAADEIVDYAAKTPFSLIAMTTHGRSGLGRWVYGSVAEKVLLGVSNPILLVRPG
ncbi:MAG: universal stress protein [Dehalococcoidia bacterium]|nr:MAG: universal stress protein [Dehalococcoidia bacterium]